MAPAPSTPLPHPSLLLLFKVIADWAWGTSAVPLVHAILHHRLPELICPPHPFCLFFYNLPSIIPTPPDHLLLPLNTQTLMFLSLPWKRLYLDCPLPLPLLSQTS